MLKIFEKTYVKGAWLQSIFQKADLSQIFIWNLLFLFLSLLFGHHIFLMRHNFTRFTREPTDWTNPHNGGF